MTLMTFEEMKSRYEEGEDSLDLALEKWERILKYSETVFHLSHFQEILQAAVVPIFYVKNTAVNVRNVLFLMFVNKAGQKTGQHL